MRASRAVKDVCLAKRRDTSRGARSPFAKICCQRFSDVLVFGSTSLVPRWIFDTAVQFNPDSHRIERSLASVRYSPGPYRTVGLTYRLTRDLSEQVELGWQWPIYGRTPVEAQASRSAGHDGGSCSGS